MGQIEENHSLFVFVWVVSSLLFVPLIRGFIASHRGLIHFRLHERGPEGEIRIQASLGAFVASAFFGFLFVLFVVKLVNGFSFLHGELNEDGFDEVAEVVGTTAYLVLWLISSVIVLETRIFQQMRGFIVYPLAGCFYAFLTMCFASGMMMPADEYLLSNGVLRTASVIVIFAIRYDFWKSGV
ncbi:hypothetical protein GF406_05470 [candidate division KSB1 bacterium]|nr:hypothetical protein [candidate division KSB1 bacterium]